MKSLKLFILLVLSQTFIYSQSGWFIQHSGTSGQSLESIFFVNDNTGFTVGYTGLILKTTNGGINWFQQNSGVSRTLQSVFFVNPSLGFIAGDSIILKTTDGGNNWSVNFYLIYDNTSISFVNQSTGFFCNHPSKYSKIYKTTNAGANWNVFYNSMYISGLYLFDENNVCAVGSNNFYRTTNGGANWNIYTIDPQGTGIFMFFVKFCDANTGYCSGVQSAFPSGFMKIYKTVNGGVNWSRQYSGNGTATDLFLTGCDTVYALQQSTIFKSVNGGANWYSQYIPPNAQPNCIFFVNNQTGYSGCINNGNILKTINGGGPVRIQVINIEVPKDFSLSQNYPNPFNPVTKIRFDIPNTTGISQDKFVKLAVYDLLGREVSLLVNEELTAGTYEINFDAATLPSGVYYYKLISGNFTQTKKMVLLK